jgi:hypothetical protein
MSFTTSDLYLGGQEQFNLGGHLIFTYSHFLTGHNLFRRYSAKSIYIILKGNIIMGSDVPVTCCQGMMLLKELLSLMKYV